CRRPGCPTAWWRCSPSAPGSVSDPNPGGDASRRRVGGARTAGALPRRGPAGRRQAGRSSGGARTRQTEFSQLDGSFAIRNGVAHNDDLDGRSEFLRVGGEGTIDLAQGRLDYRLRTRVVNTVSGRAGPEMVFLNNVTVPVQLNGPFGNIEWQVNWASVTAAVAALSVPNAAAGTVTGVARGAAGVVRGAAGILRSVPEALTPAPR
ncbi:MAG TPA: AsmA-like C-terminal region-containing protein, partial [Rubrivivax sp.]|nr:AsmA-like C-terminal region-containing protein [Rubrivivax sp.]